MTGVFTVSYTHLQIMPNRIAIKMIMDFSNFRFFSNWKIPTVTIMAPRMANFAAQPLSLGNTVNPDKIRKHPNADKMYPVSFFICICLSSVAYCAASVSYTHLDVYKRQ